MRQDISQHDAIRSTSIGAYLSGINSKWA